MANVPEDELGVAYGFLIKKFADDSGHTAQEFCTNRTVVHSQGRADYAFFHHILASKVGRLIAGLSEERQEKIPPLNILVVNKDSREPGRGIARRCGGLDGTHAEPQRPQSAAEKGRICRGLCGLCGSA